MSRRVVPGIVLMMAAALAGCGGEEAPPTAAVSGKVTFDGQPVTEGDVNFASDAGFAASGPLQADGTYTLNTQYGDMPLGTYKVSVTPPAPDDPTGNPGSAPPPLPDPENIPKKYREFSTSGLTAEVTETQTEFNFELEPGS